MQQAGGNIAKSAVIVHEAGEFGTGTAKLRPASCRRSASRPRK